MITGIMTTLADQDTQHLPGQEVVVRQGTTEGHFLGIRHLLDILPAADHILRTGRILLADRGNPAEGLQAARTLGCSLLHMQHPGDHQKVGSRFRMSAARPLLGAGRCSRQPYPTTSRLILGAA